MAFMALVSGRSARIFTANRRCCLRIDVFFRPDLPAVSGRLDGPHGPSQTDYYRRIYDFRSVNYRPGRDYPALVSIYPAGFVGDFRRWAFGPGRHLYDRVDSLADGAKKHWGLSIRFEWESARLAPLMVGILSEWITIQICVFHSGGFWGAWRPC